MVTQAPKRGAIFGALAFSLSCIGLIIFVWTQFGGTIPFAPQGYRVKAVFTETGLLVPKADVRIAGVTVGKVANVQAEGIHSLVTIDIGHQYAPIARDTSAVLRQKTLLGEAFVELSPGSKAAGTLPDGGTIQMTRIQQSQQLDQVLNSFNTPTQHHLQQLLNGTYTALYGRGQDLSNAVGNAATATSYAARIASGLDGERGSVQSFVQNTGTVLSAVGARASDLQTLITNGNQVLAATAARNAALTATVNALPPFLAQLRTTLSTLSTTLTFAKPTIAALLPAGPLLNPALTDIIALSNPAIRLLHQAPGLITAADAALPAITTFAQAFRPAVETVLPATENIIPMINLVNLYKPELIGSMANVGATFQGSAPATTNNPVGNLPTGEAHYGRVLPPLNAQMFFGQAATEPDNRHNGYIAPGGWSTWATGLPSSDCNNLRNAPAVPLAGSQPNVPCVASKGFSFNGITRYYPQLTRAPAAR
jgi:virulence factor Mce-like protein